MLTAPHAAIGDCEALVGGALAWQPANTVSSVAFVLAGIWLARQAAGGSTAQRRFGLVVGSALVAVGVGSVVFHGPGTAAARWVHDVGIAALLLVVLANGVAELRGDERAMVLAPIGLAVVAAALVFAPTASVSLSAALAGLVVATEVLVAVRGRAPGRTASTAYRLAVGLLAAGAVVNVLSRTDGAWCRPESLWQGHAVWHLAAAVAVAAWGAAVLRHPPHRPLP